MNKKSQFFIVSIALFSMALTSIILMLTVPTEFSKSSLESQIRDYNDFYSSVKTLQQLSSSVNKYWPMLQSNRLSFELANLNETSIDNQFFILNLGLGSNAREESFYLTRDGKKISFSISKSGNANYLLGFKDSITTGQTNTYYLMFNNASEDNTYFIEKDKESDYSDSGSIIRYESNTYYAEISRSTGRVTALKLKGEDYSLMSLDSAANTNLQSSCSASYAFVSYFNNVLRMNFTCPLGAVTLNQYYDFHPQFFTVNNSYVISSPGSYNLSLNFASSLNSLASEAGISQPLSQPALTPYNTRYASLFYNDYGALLIGNDSNPYIITSPNINVEYRINSSSFLAGTYSQRITIMPYYNGYSYAVTAAENYFNNPASSSKSALSEYLNNFRLSFLSMLSNSFNNLEFSFNKTFSKKMMSSYSPMPKYALSEFSISMQGLLNKSVLDESGNEASFSFSTKNYARNSSFPYYLSNDQASNVDNTTFEFMKINGSEILLSIFTTAQINAKLYNSLGEILLDTDVSANSIIPVAASLNGVYRLIISNDGALFTVSVNSPLISAKSPIILNASTESALFFKKSGEFSFEKSNKDGAPRAALYTGLSVLENSTADFSYSSAQNHYSKVGYYVNVSAGKVLLDNKENFGAKEYYLPADYEITGFMLKEYYMSEYYSVNDSSGNNYSAMDYSSSSLSNSDYLLDFSGNDLFIDSANWVYGSEFFTMNGLSFTFNGIILDTPLVKSFQLDSANGSIILSAVNDSKLLRMDFENMKSDMDLTFNIRVKATSDNYYLFNSESGYYSSSTSFNSKSLTRGYNFIAKNDSGSFFAVIFDADSLKESGSSLSVANNYLELSLSKHSKPIYLYFTDNYYELLKIADGANNDIAINNELLSYDYSYISQNFNSNGTILG